jgi:hypothetical protein
VNVSDTPPQSNDGAARHIVRLHGVYDADGTIRGEVAYWIGARLGRRHCSLCAITHGAVKEKSEWATCQVGLPVPFDTHHRDDQPAAVRNASGGAAPVVVAETNQGYEVLLTPADLDACDGSIDRLLDAIEKAAAQRELSWTAA